MKRIAAIMVLCLSLAGCEPYVQMGYAVRDMIKGPFVEDRVASDAWMIRAGGNSFTSEEKIRELLMRRAAELTLQSGYRKFKIIDGDAGVTENAPPGFRETHPATDQIAVHVVYGKPWGKIAVKMFTGDEANALDAEEIKARFN